MPSPVGKKRLTFGYASTLSSSDAVVEKLEVKRMDCGKFIQESLQNTESETKNCGWSRQICRRRSSDCSDELPPSKRSYQSPHCDAVSSKKDVLVNGKSSSPLLYFAEYSASGRDRTNYSCTVAVNRTSVEHRETQICTEKVVTVTNNTTPQSLDNSPRQSVHQADLHMECLDKDSQLASGTPDVWDIKVSEKLHSPSACIYRIQTSPKCGLLYNSPSCFLNPLATCQPSSTLDKSGNVKTSSPVTWKADTQTSLGHVDKCLLRSIPSDKFDLPATYLSPVTVPSVYQEKHEKCNMPSDKHDTEPVENVSSTPYFSPLILDINSSPSVDFPYEELILSNNLSHGEQTLLLSSPTDRFMKLPSTSNSGLCLPELRSTTPQQLSVAATNSHENQVSQPNGQYTKDTDASPSDAFSVDLQCSSDGIMSQDVQPYSSEEHKMTDAQCPDIKSLCPRTSKEQVSTPSYRFEVNEIIWSPARALVSLGLDSFITPEGRPYIYPSGAPRKLQRPARRHHSPVCKRSLTR